MTFNPSIIPVRKLRQPMILGNCWNRSPIAFHFIDVTKVFPEE
jgi:hypothetical protein